MNIIEVIPIAKGMIKDTLSYFTSEEVKSGYIVSVPLRNKKVKAIVTSVKKVTEVKAEIKSAKFSLKKVDRLESEDFLDERFINAVTNTSKYYISTPGSMLKAVIPEYVLDNIDKLKRIKNKSQNKKNNKDINKYSFEGNDEERYKFIKSHIRQEFAKNNSVFILYPTIEEARFGFETIKKGVSEYSYIIHGSMNNKEIIKTWNNIVEEKHPVVIVGSYGFLSLYREDIKSIIVEKENSRSYKLQRRPFPDIRNFVENIAKEFGIDIYFGGNILRLETVYKKKLGEVKDISKFIGDTENECDIEIVDIKKENNTKDKDGRNNEIVIADKTKSLLERSIKNNRTVFLLAFRRGTSTLTVCEDCQSVVLCNNCKSPIVLHKNTFVCHKCGERRSSEEYCKNCGSWKLKAIGVGIDKVFDYINNNFKGVSVYKIDQDSIKSETDIRNTIEKWQKDKGILIGTEMAIPYIHENIDYTVLIGVDSLFSLPDFRIEERIFNILDSLRSKTLLHMTVETRKIDERIFEYFSKENINNFFNKTLEERFELGYPPFKTLIKITIPGKKKDIVEDMDKIRNILHPIDIDIFPAFTRNQKGEEVLHGIIRIPNDLWPNETIFEKLAYLNPKITINVDPESLL